MDGGAWWAMVHGVAKSRTRLSDFTFTFFHFSSCVSHEDRVGDGMQSAGLVFAIPDLGVW